MTIRLSCPHCGKRIKAPGSHAGKRALCPRCREEIFVPVPPPAEPPKAEEDDVHGGGLVPAGPKQEEEDIIDMTAMVDIVFFLLIFFMVTSMHAIQASIAVPPPDIEKPKTEIGGIGKPEDDTVTVRIEADSTVWIDDEEAIGRQDVIARLRDTKDEHMAVKAHGEAKHGIVVMVLDAGADAGINEVRLVTVDDSEM
ncbi:MAG TPA: biopolymer transporter ExbD [Pirellulales bacterium]|nr:biopolymer transporter ExbD [Pirellulales bacterium]